MTFSPSGWSTAAAMAVVLATTGCGQAPTVDALLQDSADATRAGNVSLARRLTRDAVATAPASGPAHVAAARVALAEGDGVAAEGEISRATDAGIDPRTTRHLFAHARLLQGDAAGALDAARATDAPHRTYGTRIQARALAATGDADDAATLWRALMARAPDDAGVWSDYAADRLSAGDQRAAIAAAARAVSLAPHDRDALLVRARVARVQHGLAAAVPWYRTALARDPANHAALVDLAGTLGDMGRATETLATARRALAIRPGDPQALYLLAVLAARAGHVPLARGLFDRTGDAMRGVPAALLFGATLDLQTGALEQAAARLRNLLGLQPMNLRARQLLAVALLRLDAVDDALATLRPMALRDDADAYTLLLSAHAFERRGDRAQAARLIDRSLAGPPGRAAIFSPEDSVTVAAATAATRPEGDLRSATSLIRSLLAAGDTDAALARARPLAGAHAGSADAATVLGDTLSAADRGGEAIVAYRRAAALRFDEATMLRLVRALAASNDGAAAADVLARFGRQNPANVTAARLTARGRLAGGDAQGAVRTLEPLRFRIGGRDAALMGDLATAYGGVGDWPAAMRYAAAAYRLVPGSADAAHLYGWTLYRVGQLRASLPVMVKAVRLAPEQAALRWHIAQVYAALGRAADARFHAEVALRDPRFGDRAAAQALIARLAPRADPA